MSEHADLHPELRCRHIWRSTYGVEAYNVWPDPFYDRCAARATQEDGLCDHCRPGGCTAEEGSDPFHGTFCCSSRKGVGYLLAEDQITEPCFDKALFRTSAEYAEMTR